MKKTLVLLAVLLLSSLCLCACESNNLYIENRELYTPGDTEITGEVKKLDIMWTMGTVRVVYGESDVLSITETSEKEIKDKYRMLWYLDGTTLRVRYCESELSLFGFIHGKPWSPEKDLTVTLPKDFHAESVNFDLASADLETEVLNAERVDAHSASGKMVLNIGRADKADVSSASGDIEVNAQEIRLFEIGTASGRITVSARSIEEAQVDTASGGAEIKADYVGKISLDSASGKLRLNAEKFGKADLDSSSGNISVTASEFSECEIETASGDVTLTFPEALGFSVSLDTASGRFRSEIPVVMNGSVYTAGDGSAKIEVDTSSGDISIQKSK